MPLKLTPERARAIAISNGFTPLESYVGLRKPWLCRRNECGHEFAAKYESIQQETQGCPICSGHSVLEGFNDLASKFPEFAAQADGWDHSWTAQIASRTSGRGCPICSGHTVQVGFNDLKTKFPEIAVQADGWDTSIINPGSDAKKPWICDSGHRWVASIVKRTSSGRGCPYCSNNKVLKGFSDLGTRFPEIAAQADGWDPSIVNAYTNKKMKWKLPVFGIKGYGMVFALDVFFRRKTK